VIAAWGGLEGMETEPMSIGTGADAEDEARNRFMGDLHYCMRISHLMAALIASTRVAGSGRLSMRY